MDLSTTEELSIGSIIHYWFRYEPKEETGAAKRKYYDERKKTNALLNRAADDGSLKVRVEVKETFIPCFPNSFTGEFPTQRENTLYQGLPYTKKNTTELRYVTRYALAQFLWSINKTPPEDSPLMTDWLINCWPDDEPQAEEVDDVGEVKASTAKTVKDGDIYSHRKAHFEALSIDLDQHPDEIYKQVIKTKDEVWYKQKQAKGVTGAFVELSAFDRDFLQKYYKDVGKERIKGARPKAK